MGNLFDLQNMKIGRLTVKERIENTKNGMARWACVCDCGNKRIVKGSLLKKEIITCCKKCNFEDFTGRKIGKLKVVKRSEDKISTDGHPVITWECQCECGEKVTRVSAHLRRGGCCCLKCKANNEHNKFGYKDLRSHYWYSVQTQAAKRGIEFDVTMEYAWNVFEMQKGMCALSDIPLFFAKTKKDHVNGSTTASVDRIDSSKGYIEGNIQWVHKWVNIMKSDFTTEEFIDFCTKIIKCHQRKTNENSASNQMSWR